MKRPDMPIGFAGNSAKVFRAAESEKAMNSGDKAAAIKYAKQALELADKGIYKSREISVDATLKLSEIAGGK